MPPAADEVEPFPIEEDSATKSYNLEELNRLRAISQRVREAQIAAAQGVPEIVDEDSENFETSRINLEAHGWKNAPTIDDADSEFESVEDQTTNRMALPFRRPVKPIVKPSPAPRAEAAAPPVARSDKADPPRGRAGAAAPPIARSDAPTRPDMIAPIGNLRAPLSRKEAAPDLEVTEPREIEDEDSSDDRPTVRRRSTRDEEDPDDRSTLRRKKKERPPAESTTAPRLPATPAPPVPPEDDPFEDGPTRMRPPLEVVGPPQARMDAPTFLEQDELETNTTRLPENIAGRLNAQEDVTVPMPSRKSGPPSPPLGGSAGAAWGSEGRSSSVPPRGKSSGLARLVSTQPLAPVSAASVAQKAGALSGPQSGAALSGPQGGALGGPQSGALGPRSNTPPVGLPPAGPASATPVGAPNFPSPWAASPVHTPSYGSPSLPLPAASPGRQRLIAALVGIAIGLVVLFIYGIFAENDSLGPQAPAPHPPTASAAAPVIPLLTATATAAATASAASSSWTPAQMDAAERDAREALLRIREGLGACVERTPSFLPETAPAVPSSLKLTHPDGYTAKPEDWKAPIFLCTKWSAIGPMRYQIQWQSEKPFQEGTAVAWIDRRGDGSAEKALSLRVTLKPKGKLEFSEIQSVDPGFKLLSKP